MTPTPDPAAPGRAAVLAAIRRASAPFGITDWHAEAAADAVLALSPAQPPTPAAQGEGISDAAVEAAMDGSFPVMTREHMGAALAAALPHLAARPAPAAPTKDTTAGPPEYGYALSCAERQVRILSDYLERVKPDNWHEDPDWCEIVGYLAEPYLDDEPAAPKAIEWNDDTSRCAACAWPLADTQAEGCVRGDCSQRPFPDRMYNEARYRREQAPPPSATPTTGDEA